MVLILALQGDQSALRLAQDFALPEVQLAAKVFPLPLAHERFFIAWTIFLVDDDNFFH